METQTQNSQLEAMTLNIPVWDESVWSLLKKKDYEKAMNQLFSLLTLYTPKTAAQIFWGPIIEGHPQIRGDVPMNDWLEQIVPRLALIIYTVADKRLFEQICFSLEPTALEHFLFVLIANLPGGDMDEKIAFIPEEKSWLASYFMGSPLVAALEIIRTKNSSIPTLKKDTVLERITALPPALKYVFSSVQLAERVNAIAEESDISTEKIADYSYLIAGMLLGMEAPENPKEYFAEHLGLTSEQTELLEENTQELIIAPYLTDIKELKEATEPLIKDNEISVTVRSGASAPETKLKINKIEFPTKDEESIPTRPGEAAPFILRKEAQIGGGGNEGKTGAFGKGFSLPFGFFKKRSEPEAPTKVSVTVEGGGISKVSTIVPIQAKSTSPKGIFEAIKSELEKKPEATGTDAAPKTVHYSAYKTELPKQGTANNIPAGNAPAGNGAMNTTSDDKEPHVEGNVIFFQ